MPDKVLQNLEKESNSYSNGSPRQNLKSLIFLRAQHEQFE